MLSNPFTAWEVEKMKKEMDLSFTQSDCAAAVLLAKDLSLCHRVYATVSDVVVVQGDGKLRIFYIIFIVFDLY